MDAEKKSRADSEQAPIHDVGDEYPFAVTELARLYAQCHSLV